MPRQEHFLSVLPCIHTSAKEQISKGTDQRLPHGDAGLLAEKLRLGLFSDLPELLPDSERFTLSLLRDAGLP